MEIKIWLWLFERNRWNQVEITGNRGTHAGNRTRPRQGKTVKFIFCEQPTNFRVAFRRSIPTNLTVCHMCFWIFPITNLKNVFIFYKIFHASNLITVLKKASCALPQQTCCKNNMLCQSWKTVPWGILNSHIKNPCTIDQIHSTSLVLSAFLSNCHRINM